MIKISEIFSNTIQGEGPHAGLRSMFIRVTACDFHCSFCDSAWAWNDPNSIAYTEDELAKTIINQARDTNVSNIILTGGNPCIYDFTSVIDELHKAGLTVDVETQGSLFPEWLKKLDLVVFSPKPPSSNEPDVYNRLTNWLNEIDPSLQVCIKIPVFTEEDIEFCQKYYDLTETLRKNGKNISFYLSVGNTDVHEEGDISPRVLRDYEKLIMRINKSTMTRAFILPQLHTLIWGNKSGV